MKYNIITTEKNAILKNELLEIFSLLKNLDSQQIQVFVHGSWADNTRTAFSDLDDFIIVADEYFAEVQNVLDQIEFNFQKIDPTQHHGHWLIKKSQLADYDESYIPLFILENSICIKGINEINANINLGKSKEGLISNIKTTCRNIELFYTQYKTNTLNIYNLKCFVGSFVLLPPLIFQLLGVYIDKKNAISRASELFTAKSIKLIEWASFIRENWYLLTNKTEYYNFSLLIDEFNDAEKWRNYAKNNSPLYKQDDLSGITLTEDMILGFVTEALSYVDKY